MKIIKAHKRKFFLGLFLVAQISPFLSQLGQIGRNFLLLKLCVFEVDLKGKFLRLLFVGTTERFHEGISVFFYRKANNQNCSENKQFIGVDEAIRD